MSWKRSANAELDKTTRPVSSITATGTGIKANKLLINCVGSIATPVPSLVITPPLPGLFRTGGILLRGHLLCNKKRCIFSKNFGSVAAVYDRRGKDISHKEAQKAQRKKDFCKFCAFLW